MKFVVKCTSDYDVGIYEQYFDIDLPCPTNDKKEWSELCKKLLTELYECETSVKVYDNETFGRAMCEEYLINSKGE